MSKNRVAWIAFMRHLYANHLFDEAVIEERIVRIVNQSGRLCGPCVYSLCHLVAICRLRPAETTPELRKLLERSMNRLDRIAKIKDLPQLWRRLISVRFTLHSLPRLSSTTQMFPNL